MKADELDQLVVHTETKDITLSQLREMVDANDIIVNPEYQRNYVYDDKRASLLVESILSAFRSPSFIYARKMMEFIPLLMVNSGLCLLPAI